MMQKLAKTHSTSAKRSARKLTGYYANYFRFRVRDVMHNVTDATRRDWPQQ